MLRKQFLILIAVLLIATAVWAEDLKRVGVMDLNNQNRKEADYATRQINKSLRKTFEKSDKFTTIEEKELKKGLKKLSKEMGFELDLDTSLLDDEAQKLADYISADIFIMGNVIPVADELYKVTITTLDVETKERTTDEYEVDKSKKSAEAACDSIVASTEMMASESLVKYLKYARDYYKADHKDDAIQAFKRVLEFEPENFESLQTLGFIYEKSNDYKNAEKFYNEANKVNPQPTTYQHLALIFKAQGQYEDALASYQQAYEKAAELNPKKIEEKEQQIEELEDAEKIEAIEKEIEHLKQEPAHIWVNMGMMYQQDMMEYEKAIEAYEKAVEIDPNYTYALTNLGFIYQYQKEWSLAIKNFEKAIELSPDYLPSYEKLAQCYEAKAKSYCAFEDASCDTLILENRDEALEAYHHAIDVYKRLHEIEENPVKKVQYLYTIGLTYDITKEHDKSIEWFEKYIEEETDETAKAKTYCRMGFSYGSVGDNEKAKEIADKMLEKNIGLTCAYVILADIEASKRTGTTCKQLKVQVDVYRNAISLYKKALENIGPGDEWLDSYANKRINSLGGTIQKLREQIDEMEFTGSCN